MKLLLDEMYSAALAGRLKAAGIDAVTVAAVKLGGSSDPEIFAAAVAGGYVLLTENVGDFTRIAAEHSTGGGRHPGLLIALSSRFSRRAAGVEPLAAAIETTANQDLTDRIVYLERPSK